MNEFKWINREKAKYDKNKEKLVWKIRKIMN